MRAIDSAIAFSKTYNKKLVVFWELNDDCNYKFSDLFEPNPSIYKLIEIRKGFRTKIINRVAPFAFSTFNNRFLTHREVDDLFNNNFNFAELAHYKHLYVLTFSDFFRVNSMTPFATFHLKEKFIKLIEPYRRENMMGIHIRRTDNRRSIQHSPLEKFIEMMHEELDKGNTEYFFLSTDDPGVEDELQQLFPAKVISHKKRSLDRNNPIAIEDAVVDLYSLANCTHIIGSWWSSFSTTAAELKQIPIERIFVE